MQDPTTFQPMKPQFPEQEQLKCPRCDSTNTKFCYYNNYNLSQPRHYCKNCKRYWTKGGALRNIPIGGGSRKTTKRSSSSSTSKRSTTSSSISSSAVTTPEVDPTRVHIYPVEQDQRLVNIGGGGSFSSLLASNGNFGNLLEGQGLNSSGSGLKMVQMGEFGGDPVVNSGSGTNPGFGMQSSNNGSSESFLGLQNGDSSCWNGSHGWSDLSIYTTPGSSFQ